MARIALDAMGGDFAPIAPVGGALLALAELGAEHRIQLIGREAEVSDALDSALAGEFSAQVGQRDMTRFSRCPATRLNCPPEFSRRFEGEATTASSRRARS